MSAGKVFNYGPRVREVRKRRASLNQLVRLGTERAALLNQVGMRVCAQTDSGKLQTTAVKQLPWQLGHGQWVIGIEGFSGGYDILRVTPLS